MKALFLSSLFFLVGLVLLTTPVLAAPDCSDLNSLTSADQAICGVIATDPEAQTSNPEVKINATLAAVLNIFGWIIGIAAIIVAFALVSSFRLIVSGDSSEQRNKARNAILYALIGVVIAYSSQDIILFVLERV